MYELTVVAAFEAAHRIVEYPGKCNRLHGHNWSVEVTVAGETLNPLGMLIDFKELKGEVGAILDRLDHVYLNELEPFTKENPTAEHIARYVYRALDQRALFAEDIKVRSVKVWESPRSAVTYSER